LMMRVVRPAHSKPVTCIGHLIGRRDDEDDHMDVGGRTNHDYRDIGGRVTPGAVTEETEPRKPKPRSSCRVTWKWLPAERGFGEVG